MNILKKLEYIQKYIHEYKLDPARAVAWRRVSIRPKLMFKQHETRYKKQKVYIRVCCTIQSSLTNVLVLYFFAFFCVLKILNCTVLYLILHTKIFWGVNANFTFIILCIFISKFGLWRKYVMKVWHTKLEWDPFFIEEEVASCDECVYTQ